MLGVNMKMKSHRQSYHKELSFDRTWQENAYWGPIQWSIDLLGWYSETGGFHIDMDCNFVCIWRRHNCRSQVIDLSLSALISWFMKSITGFLNNSNLHAIIFTLLIINLHWVLQNYFAVFEEIYNNVGQQF
jgi:hypothetical protein